MHAEKEMKKKMSETDDTNKIRKNEMQIDTKMKEGKMKQTT